MLYSLFFSASSRQSQYPWHWLCQRRKTLCSARCAPTILLFRGWRRRICVRGKNLHNRRFLHWRVNPVETSKIYTSREYNAVSRRSRDKWNCSVLACVKRQRRKAPADQAFRGCPKFETSPGYINMQDFQGEFAALLLEFHQLSPSWRIGALYPERALAAARYTFDRNNSLHLWDAHCESSLNEKIGSATFCL